jgi:type IV secretory pathway VirB10-like protein
MSAIFSFDQPSLRRRPGIVAGIAVSLVLHAVLLFGYRLSSPPEHQQPERAMTVWLQPAKPPQIVAKLEPLPPKVTKAAPRVRSAPTPSSSPQAAEPQPTLAAQPRPAESQTITLPPAPDPLHPELQPKQFDMNAALKTARKVANEKDPARAGLPVAQLDDHPLYPENHETQLQKGVASAKKGDCLKDGAGLGLLAPLVWAFDKHCKF